uniref:tRNA-intron lyase n=1 Tax=Procambarus clarkii TaxID=6728 RepID=F5A6E6_PROCL|nr:tRNA_splicing nuclease 2 [Procambarus clarkii]
MAPDGYLQLLPEEALFLAYALGCLIVSKKETGMKNKNGKRSSSPHTYVSEMTIDSLWSTFTDDDPKFPIKYAVYHHYRTKGWVVKSGLKFGADWVLYPVGPPFYHSQYTIMIQCVWADTLDKDETLSWRELSWINISATERMNNQVNKTPLISMVLRPRSLSGEKMKRIECLKGACYQRSIAVKMESQ